jgi:hypothetical protein
MEAEPNNLGKPDGPEMNGDRRHFLDSPQCKKAKPILDVVLELASLIGHLDNVSGLDFSEWTEVPDPDPDFEKMKADYVSWNDDKKRYVALRNFLLLVKKTQLVQLALRNLSRYKWSVGVEVDIQVFHSELGWSKYYYPSTWDGDYTVDDIREDLAQIGRRARARLANAYATLYVEMSRIIRTYVGPDGASIDVDSMIREKMRGNPGRPVTTEDMGKFAFDRRNQTPPMIWKKIAAAWNAAHPDADRKVTEGAMRAALDRYLRTQKQKKNRT